MEELLQQLIETKINYDKAKKQYDDLKDKVKQTMIDNNLSSLNSMDNKISCSLNVSVRKTCKDKTKLLQELYKQNKSLYIKTEIVPDIESLSTAIDPLVQQIYKSFVKESEVYTFKPTINV